MYSLLLLLFSSITNLSPLSSYPTLSVICSNRKEPSTPYYKTIVFFICIKIYIIEVYFLNHYFESHIIYE